MPKPVTLHLDNRTCQQALLELARQSGIHVEAPASIGKAAIRLDLTQVPFWQALDSIARVCHAHVTVYPTSGRIVLVKNGDTYRLPPLCHDGCFRLTVKRMTATRDLELKETEPDSGSYTASIEIAWIPELQPLYLETRPHNVRLVDDKNHALAVPEEGSSLAPVDGRIAVALDLRLPALPRAISSIHSLDGELAMIAPSKMLLFRFESLDRLHQASGNDPERRRTQEGVTCRISKIILDRDRWTLQVTIDYPPGMKQLDSNQSWVVNNQMMLESADGRKRLVSKEYVVETATSRQAILSYRFLDRGEQHRGKASDWIVHYRTPASLVEMPIRFRFRDIPLP